MPELSEWSISLQKTTRYSDSEDDEYELNEILSKRAARAQRSNAVPNPRDSVPVSGRESNNQDAEPPKSTEPLKSVDTVSRSSSLTPSVESVDPGRAANEGQTGNDGCSNRGGAKKRGRGGQGRGKGARGRGGKLR